MCPLPRSERNPRFNPYAKDSTLQTPRPTFNIFANARGDIAYEPDPNWSRAFNKKGYNINIHRVNNLGDIDSDSTRLHSRYSVHPTGGLQVNGQRIPMLQSGMETRYILDGFEHGRTYVPNSPDHPPMGEVRAQTGQEWNGREKSMPNVKCSKNKVLYLAGVVAVLLVACIVPGCCK